MTSKSLQLVIEIQVKDKVSTPYQNYDVGCHDRSRQDSANDSITHFERSLSHTAVAVSVVAP